MQPLVCELIFPPLVLPSHGAPMRKKHIQSKGKICLMWKHTGYSIIITLSNLLNLITGMISSCTECIKPSLWLVCEMAFHLKGLWNISSLCMDRSYYLSFKSKRDNWWFSNLSHSDWFKVLQTFLVYPVINSSWPVWKIKFKSLKDQKAPRF